MVLSKSYSYLPSIHSRHSRFAGYHAQPVPHLPYSENTFDEAVAAVLSATQPRTVLDVGCDAGKYGRIVRASLDATVLVGYEPERSYVTRFGLRKLYDEVRVQQIQDAMRVPSEHFDMCIFGDSLEHLPKSAGSDVIHFFLYRSSFIVVVAPLEYLQDNGEQGEIRGAPVVLESYGVLRLHRCCIRVCRQGLARIAERLRVSTGEVSRGGVSVARSSPDLRKELDAPADFAYATTAVPITGSRWRLWGKIPHDVRPVLHRRSDVEGNRTEIDAVAAAPVLPVDGDASPRSRHSLNQC